MVRFGNVRRIWSNPVAIQYVHKTIYSNLVSQNNRYINAYVQRVLKADFLLSFVTRCCSALGRGKIKPQKSTGKDLVRVQYIQSCSPSFTSKGREIMAHQFAHLEFTVSHT